MRVELTLLLIRRLILTPCRSVHCDDYSLLHETVDLTNLKYPEKIHPVEGDY